MNIIYILVKHINTIEEDYVELVKASYEKEELLKLLNELTLKYLNKYIMIKSNNDYKKFTNIDYTYLMEIYIETLNL